MQTIGRSSRFGPRSLRRPLGIAFAVGLVLAPGVVTTVLAQTEDKPAPPASTDPGKVIASPQLRRNLVRSESLPSTVQWLDDRQYEAILQAHEARKAPVIKGLNARARTGLSTRERPFETQNNHARNNTDCNDQDPSVHPGQLEICDGKDNDCDADIDEEVTSRFFLDADGDGWGDADRPLQGCRLLEGYASRGQDCDDRSMQIYPGAYDKPENGVDENCDGEDG